MEILKTFINFFLAYLAKESGIAVLLLPQEFKKISTAALMFLLGFMFWMSAVALLLVTLFFALANFRDLIAPSAWTFGASFLAAASATFVGVTLLKQAYRV